VLLQLLRGAGIAGLAAMPDSAPLGRGRLLRPLLGVPRASLRDYVARLGLECLEDPMNLDPRFDRVHVRRTVLPMLTARWPGAVRSLARNAGHAQEARRLLADIADTDLALAADGAGLAVSVLRRLAPARRRNLLRGWLARLGARAPDARRLGQIAGPLLAARADAQPFVAWDGGRVLRTAGRLVCERAPVDPPAPGGVAIERWSWRDAPTVRLPGARGRLELRRDVHGVLDLDSLPATLSVRWRSGGERLRPRPGGPTRTVKSLMQEARIPPWEREAMPLLHAGERLIAVGDRWVDAAHQARDGARTRGRIVWRRAPRHARPGERDLLT
ncbi:MAG: tRNA lysidine(34) synthetase TilS, partial [Steroidobacteraceae bacterium]